jgi:hypothetical protein
VVNLRHRSGATDQSSSRPAHRTSNREDGHPPGQPRWTHLVAGRRSRDPRTRELAEYAAHVEPPAETQPSVEALATNSGVNVTCVCACSGFVASSMTSWAAVRPSSWRGWRTDVSGTAAADANSMSS